MMRMRLLAAAAVLAAGCATASSGAADRTAALGDDFRLPRGETAEVGGLSVRFAQVVEDSRCPLGVQCIRAGEAKIQLALRTGDQRRTVVLATEGAQPTAADFAGYEVRLITVDPPRRRNDPAPAYVATLRVMRR
jgi:hypothetical protein